MSTHLENLVQEIIEDSVAELQDVLSLRINEKEQEQDRVLENDPERFEELYEEISYLAEESKVLGEIRDGYPKHLDIKETISHALNLDEFARDYDTALRSAEEELMAAASDFISEKDSVNEDVEQENGDSLHPLSIVLQSKSDILSIAIEKLREKEFRQFLERPLEQNITHFGR